MKTSWLRPLLIGFILLLGNGCGDVTTPSKTDYAADSKMIIERRESSAKFGFTFFRIKSGSVRLKLTRPERNDERVFLSVPGTYTSPQDKPEGFVVLDGKIMQSHERQGWDGAAFFRADGTISIFSTNRGKLLTKDYLKSVERDQASFIQGHLLVHESQAVSLLPQTPYQRRALVIMDDGGLAIVESKELLELQQFADALVELGAAEALNLDMGQWSEGWYRDPISGQTVTIGYLSGATDRQSNWVVFETGR